MTIYIDVMRTSIAGRHAAIVAVNGLTLAGDQVGLDDLGLREGRSCDRLMHRRTVDLLLSL